MTNLPHGHTSWLNRITQIKFSTDSLESVQFRRICFIKSWHKGLRKVPKLVICFSIMQFKYYLF